METDTVNLEIFARTLFSRMALKYIFATLKVHDQGMIYLQSDLAISREFYFHETSHDAKFRGNKTLAKILNL